MAAEVVRVAHFAQLSRQLAALAQAFGEAPDLKEKQRTEARRVHEQSLELADAGGVRAPLASVVDSLQQQSTGASMLVADVTRLTSDLLSLQKMYQAISVNLETMSGSFEARLEEHRQRLEQCSISQDALEGIRTGARSEAERLTLSEGQRVHASILPTIHLLEKRLEALIGEHKVAVVQQEEGFRRVMDVSDAVANRIAKLEDCCQTFGSKTTVDLQKVSDRVSDGLATLEERLERTGIVLDSLVQADFKFQAQLVSACQRVDRHARAMDTANRDMTHLQEGVGRLTKDVKSVIGAMDALTITVDDRKEIERALMARCDGIDQVLRELREALEVDGEDLKRATAEAKTYCDDKLEVLKLSLMQTIRDTETGITSLVRGFTDTALEEIYKRILDFHGCIENCQAVSEQISSKLENTANAGLDVSKRLDCFAADFSDACAKLHRTTMKLEEVEGEMTAGFMDCLASQRAHSSDLQESKEEWARNLAYHSERYADAMEEEQALRFAVAKSVEELRGDLTNNQKDFSSCLHDFLAETSHRSANLEARLSEDVQLLRAELQECTDANSRRTQTIDDRFEDKIASVADELKCLVRGQNDRISQTRQLLGNELERLVAEATVRFQSIVDGESSRVDAFRKDLDRLRADDVVKQQLQAIAIAKLEQLAESVKDDVSLASVEIGDVKSMVCDCSESIGQLQEKVALKSFGDLHAVIGSLASAVMTVAQCCGLVGGLEEKLWDRVGAAVVTKNLSAGSIGVQEVLEWSRSDVPLAARIERSWNARVSTKAGTLLELIQQKADTQTMFWIQECMRDLDTRAIATQADSVRIPNPKEEKGTITLLGPPYVGAFGSQTHARRGDDTSRVWDTQERHDKWQTISTLDHQRSMQATQSSASFSSWHPSTSIPIDVSQFTGDSTKCQPHPPMSGRTYPSSLEGPLHRRALVQSASA